MPALSQEARHHRARVAALSRDRASDDPEYIDAQRSFTEAQLRDAIQRALRKAPPLNDEQRVRLAELLRPARDAIKQARLARLNAEDGGDDGPA